MKKVSWEHVKLLLLVSLLFIYSVSMWLVDYGASLKSYNECGECYKALGIDNTMHFVMQSLIFKSLEPRIAYHIGLIIGFAVVITLGFLYIYEVV